MDKDKKIPRYQTDEITVQLIETVLNIAAQAAQLQITEESAESIFALTDAVAERFGIETRLYEIDEGDPGPNRSITIYKTQKEGRPVNTNQPIINGNVFPFPFRVIDGDKNPDTKDD